MIRVGLVGYGLAGAVFHAPLIRSVRGLDLAGVMTSRDVPGAARTYDELLDRSDLVVIASPNLSHFPLARTALEAGKHVVVDKPFTVTLAEADDLMALADRVQRVLTVFHNRRWDGDFLTVQKLLPRLGQVSLFEAHWDRFRPAIKLGWREVAQEGSGLLNDFGPHMIDQALLLFGAPEAVSADIVAQRPDAKVDDYFALTLHYGRMRAVLSASTLISDPRPRFAVYGCEGSFVKFGLDPQEARLKEGVPPKGAGIDPLDGTFTDAAGERGIVRTERGNYLRFYEAVADAVLSGAPPPVDPRDAREGLRLIEAARTSASEGKLVRL